MKTLLYLGVLIVGSVALMLQGDFGAAGIALLIIGMMAVVAMSPFAAMPTADRRRARLTATALVLAGWFLAGALVFDWEGASYAVAGIAAVIALVKAANVPDPPADAQPQSR